MLILTVTIVAGLLPGFAWLVFYLSEADHPEPKRYILFTFLVGMAYGFFTVALEEIFNRAGTHIGIIPFSIASLVGLAVIEEIMKFSAAHFAIAKTPELVDPVDAMIYMIVAALGFATLENIGAIAGISDQVGYIPMALQTISFRFIGATLLHTLAAGIIGYFWALGLKKGREWKYVLAGLVIATTVHAAFNYLVLRYGDTGYSVLFLVVVGFFVLNDFERLKFETTKSSTQTKVVTS